MTRAEALRAFADGRTSYNEHHIKVRTRSGAEYDVSCDVIEECDYDDPYVYGTRTNGRLYMRGRRRTDTRDQLRWFLLRNVTLV